MWPQRHPSNELFTTCAPASAIFSCANGSCRSGTAGPVPSFDRAVLMHCATRRRKETGSRRWPCRRSLVWLAGSLGRPKKRSQHALRRAVQLKSTEAMVSPPLMFPHSPCQDHLSVCACITCTCMLTDVLARFSFRDQRSAIGRPHPSSPPTRRAHSTTVPLHNGTRGVGHSPQSGPSIAEC